MSPVAWIILAGLCAVVVVILIERADQRSKRRRRAEQLEAAVRAQAIAESIPLRGITVRGASRDRQLSGKARRRARRVS